MRLIERCPRCGFSNEDLRTQEQNDKMWAMLTDIARQKQWPVDGQMVYMQPWEWKDVFTSALKKSHRVAMGLEGGFVVLGGHTSKMTRGLMSELIELISATGVEWGIKWSERVAYAANA